MEGIHGHTTPRTKDTPVTPLWTVELYQYHGPLQRGLRGMATLARVKSCTPRTKNGLTDCDAARAKLPTTVHWTSTFPPTEAWKMERRVHHRTHIDPRKSWAKQRGHYTLARATARLQ